MKQAKHKSAFTLIELLVVIAIIALLAAILFPVFARAREKARQSTCASNLKQIGLSFAQYTQDYDEKLPPVESRYCIPDSQFIIGPPTWANGGSPEGPSCSAGQPNHPGWVEATFPYLKSKQLLVCPSDFSGSTPFHSAGSGPQQSSYAMSHFLGWKHTTGTYANWGAGATDECAGYYNNGQGTCGDGGYPLSGIPRTAEIVMMTEFGQEHNDVSNFYEQIRSNGYFVPWWYGGDNYHNTQSGDYCVYNTTCQETVHSNHGGMTNFLFIDGHVKAQVAAGMMNTSITASTTWLPVSMGQDSTVLDDHWHPDK